MQIMPYPSPDHDLDTYMPPLQREVTIETVIGAWLHDTFSAHSHSQRTRATYTNELAAFRKLLLVHGRDLTDIGMAALPLDAETRTVRTERLEEQLTAAAQLFAASSVRGKPTIAPSTRNKRLAVLSSFYAFATLRYRRLFPFRNPIDILKRSKVQEYDTSKALDLTTVAEQVPAIDANTDEGARDKAILAVLLQTGRRVAEVANLTIGDIEIDGRSGLVTLTFQHAKGGKVMRDMLPKEVSAILLTWLARWYKYDLLTFDKTAPVWVILAKQHTRRVKQVDGSYTVESDYGKPLEYQGFRRIVRRYLGTTKVHRTRHTFVLAMLKTGASIRDVQKRLGQDSVATTEIYAGQLQQADNPYAEQIASLFGLK